MRRGLFIFRRDLRLDDNTALLAASKSCDTVIPIFIFDPRQINVNPYFSPPAFNFMLSALAQVADELAARGGRLYCFKGLAHEWVDKLIRAEKIAGVYVNSDYTPFSRERDSMLESVCKRRGVAFHAFDDYLLNAPDKVLKDDGKPYTIYTPYAKKAMLYEVKAPVKNQHTHYENKTIDGHEPSLIKGRTPAGRPQALRILKIIGQYANYDQLRNVPYLDATTRLSVHHKFGTCSIRESFYTVLKAFGPGHALIREFYWRDFFTQIGFHFPRVLKGSFHEEYNRLSWDNNDIHFRAWCEGKTGFPIVDAGMRELNTTGFMHNRLRMIVASFLIKDLHIDWRLGERYFANKLMDYDPLVNNGNWQWTASTGCDAQPYFRIFNPWLQQEKFDPDARYIKRWVPELAQASIKDVHGIVKKNISFKLYPRPIVSHDQEKIKTLGRYKSL